MNTLDSDLLRSFLAVSETGSMTDGAARVFRTQSAISLQIKRLETLLGQPVFDRHGRGVRLTQAGESLLPVAQEVTARLDDTLRRLSTNPVSGKLRLGIPDDHGRDRLARIIADFTRDYPGVELDVTCGLSTAFPDMLTAAKLDLAIYEVQTPAPTDEVLWTDPTHWMAARHHDVAARDPLPVAMFDRDCWWRDAALAALDKLGRPYRVVYSSQSVAGVVAAIESGVAVGLLGLSSLTGNLRILGPKDGFAAMPVSHLVLGSGPGPDSPARHGMAETLRHAFGATTAT